MDRVYLPRADRLLTAWIPLGRVTTSDGAMTVAVGSHRSAPFAALRSSYGRTKPADGTRGGWIADDPNDIETLHGTGKIEWASADFEPGDVCVLGVDLLHMTSNNTTDRWRISCDTRWLPVGSRSPFY
ncbi:hypothetical protein BDK51DRAFT_25517 [Blyttiomyces helicus]|uniref:Phytanoyl-CoA dioxygenase n=1 Tax=Blyttiomyces helicus TaxID=388810 RepID=A0A4P9W1M9_9FUNG|nr:hypothetical protein BDK51DRAFT_25517 [Blyttiomyces helicus]|eukprot:RKO85063.1 hypothetical protein BDK51DRAFT_25517 [Blyttiomyces helicus]